MRFNDISDDKITRIRLLLELAAAEDAALNATDADIAGLERINNQMELNKNDNELRIAMDCEFHNAIARLSHNELLALMVESISGMLKVYMARRLQQHPQGNEEGIQDHRRIIKAIKSHNSTLARKLVKLHIERSYSQIEEFRNTKRA
jgi:GntR family transcriptional repressor for pyruvate dehydrogenase complex